MASRESTVDAPIDGRDQAGTRPAPLAQVRAAFNALVARLFAPVDISSIVVFRIAFGLIMLWEVNRYLSYGWVASYYIDPIYNFPYVGFDWVKPLPGNLMYVHFYALALLAVFITLGLWYRISATLFWLGFTYVFLLEKAHYLNHLYLAVLISFLMILIPAHRSFSLDARRRPSLQSDTAPTWALALLATQVGIIYFYGGLAKINWDWLNGEPMRTWMANETNFPILGRWFTEEWMVYVVSYSGLLLDLCIVPLLLWSGTRWYAVTALVLFHRFNAEMFSIGIFPTFATAAIILFLPPDLPRRVLAFFQHSYQSRRKVSRTRVMEAAQNAPALPFMQRPLVQRATVVFVLGYISFQLLFPLRQHLYPGNTVWADYGDRFAWRMMLNSRVGEVMYVITDPMSGQTWEVDPADYLTMGQLNDMDSHPDMILQFSHYLADEWQAKGFDNVEVRANTAISLNGRPAVPLIDPTVDLASEEHKIGPVDWITSLGEEQRLLAERETASGDN